MMRTERIAFCVAALGAGLVYGWTSAPGLGLVDSGELTTVATTLSIAHPTGYPLYTLIGHLWQMCLPVEAARAMVLFSVACAALAVGVLAITTHHVLARWTTLPRQSTAIVAVLLSWALAFSGSVWTSIAFAEVYPLTLLLAAIVLWIATSAVLGNHYVRRGTVLFAMYVWGLGFGNHFTILWFFPVLVWLAARFIIHAERPRQAVLWVIVAFAAGASVNLFLPIRSSVEPLLDWSDPQTASHLLRHLTAWQYRVWMFQGGIGEFLQNFLGYLKAVLGDFGWGLTILAAIGLLRVVRTRQWGFLTLVATWLVGVSYNLNYSIPDIATYFVAFYAPLFIFSILGFVSLIEATKGFKPSSRGGIAISLAILPAALSFASALKDANHHADTFAVDHARAVLATLPDSAVVFQANWDLQSPVTYLQNVEQERTDVAMFDLALLQRPWYLKQEQRRHPDVFADCEGRISAFESAVAPFESGQSYSAQQLEAAYVDMVNCLIEQHYQQRPVYVRDTRNVGHPGVAAKLPTYPGGYFFRVGATPQPEPLLRPDKFLSSVLSHDEREQYLLRQAAVMTALRGSFSLESGDTVTAAECRDVAIRLAPNDPVVSRFLSQLNSVPAQTR